MAGRSSRARALPLGWRAAFPGAVPAGVLAAVPCPRCASAISVPGLVPAARLLREAVGCYCGACGWHGARSFVAPAVQVARVIQAGLFGEV